MVFKENKRYIDIGCPMSMNLKYSITSNVLSSITSVMSQIPDPVEEKGHRDQDHAKNNRQRFVAQP